MKMSFTESEPLLNAQQVAKLLSVKEAAHLGRIEPAISEIIWAGKLSYYSDPKSAFKRILKDEIRGGPH